MSAYYDRSGTGNSLAYNGFAVALSWNLPSMPGKPVVYQNQDYEGGPLYDCTADLPADDDGSGIRAIIANPRPTAIVTNPTVYVGGAFFCPESAVWTAPTMPGYVLKGWFSIYDDISYQVQYTPQKTDFSTWITAKASPTWGELKAALHHWQHTSVGNTHSYYNYLRLIYEPESGAVWTFNPCGGTLANAADYFKRVTYGQSVGTLPTPTKDGVSFDGWYTAEIGGTLVTASTVAASSMGHTLYAHWGQGVTLVGNGGYFLGQVNAGGVPALGNVPTKWVSLNGSHYGSLPAPDGSNPGMTFVGYYTLPSGGTRVQQGDAVVGGPLYAHWTYEGVPVTFNGNGGTPATQTRSYMPGGVYGQLPSAARDGYEFAGWFTAADGGVEVTAGDYIYLGYTTLYAHWRTSSISSAVWSFGGASFTL